MTIEYVASTLLPQALQADHSAKRVPSLEEALADVIDNAIQEMESIQQTVQENRAKQEERQAKQQEIQAKQDELSEKRDLNFEGEDLNEIANVSAGQSFESKVVEAKPETIEVAESSKPKAADLDVTV